MARGFERDEMGPPAKRTARKKAEMTEPSSADLVQLIHTLAGGGAQPSAQSAGPMRGGPPMGGGGGGEGGGEVQSAQMIMQGAQMLMQAAQLNPSIEPIIRQAIDILRSGVEGLAGASPTAEAGGEGRRFAPAGRQMRRPSSGQLTDEREEAGSEA